jgi:hypothetical protein
MAWHSWDDNHHPVLITENNFGLLTPLRQAQSFSLRLRDDVQSAGLTRFHRVLQASLTTPSADLLVLFNAFTFWIMPQFDLTVNKTVGRVGHPPYLQDNNIHEYIFQKPISLCGWQKIWN